MMPSPKEWTFRQVVWATLVFVLVALGFYLLFRSSQVLLILFIAIFIGTVMRPAVKWLNSLGLSYNASAVFVYLLVFLLIVGFLLLLFPLIAEQGGKIITSLPDYYHNFHDWVATYPNHFISQLSLLLPANLPTLSPAQQTNQQTLDAAKQVLGIVVSVSKAIFIAIVIVLMSFYWTLYGSRMIQSITLMFPNSGRERARDLITAMEAKLSAFITGQAILCFSIGILALIAYLLIGLPNALVLAFIAGVLEAVPVIGPALGAVPAGLVALSIAPSKLLWVIVATIVIQFSENHLLVPRVMRKAVGVNPFVSLVALFAFSSLIGVAGALLAIPIVALVQLILEYFVFDTRSKEPEQGMGRDYISVLRYEAQELIHDLRKQARHKRGETDLGVQQIDRLVDEIEAIATDLDSVLSRDQDSGAP
jgi:predicted PurR-regulated permease PerM